jgi:tellurite resistance protein
MGSVDTGVVKGLTDAKLEALVEIMFLAAASDEEFSEVERKHFVASVESLTSGRLSGDKLEQLLGQARKELDAAGRQARLDSVKARLPEPAARRVALSLAIQVTAADGIIRTSERELIFEAAEALEIDRDEAADLVRDLSPS